MVLFYILRLINRDDCLPTPWYKFVSIDLFGQAQNVFIFVTERGYICHGSIDFQSRYAHG